ncbi:hypothetical protein B0H63DRAFT_451120 [Podospora didyma]|uniref:Uncharacterized protein n=1 Tax=Podospora didyma TaxID=330526 RepID=A0AAE0NI15_9PEZI|nr:hypothetical protein B0H63DRAFT_451120 [Podospora didyma]
MWQLVSALIRVMSLWGVLTRLVQKLTTLGGLQELKEILQAGVVVALQLGFQCSGKEDFEGRFAFRLVMNAHLFGPGWGLGLDTLNLPVHIPYNGLVGQPKWSTSQSARIVNYQLFLRRVPALFREPTADTKTVGGKLITLGHKRLEGGRLVQITIVSHHQLGNDRSPHEWEWQTFAADYLPPSGSVVATRVDYLYSQHRPGAVKKRWDGVAC